MSLRWVQAASPPSPPVLQDKDIPLPSVSIEDRSERLTGRPSRLRDPPDHGQGQPCGRSEPGRGRGGRRGSGLQLEESTPRVHCR